VDVERTLEIGGRRPSAAAPSCRGAAPEREFLQAAPARALNPAASNLVRVFATRAACPVDEEPGRPVRPRTVMFWRRAAEGSGNVPPTGWPQLTGACARAQNCDSAPRRSTPEHAKARPLRVF